jgi:hypothetical protein
MEEALHDVPLYREFAQIGAGLVRLPDETTILRFRHLLERHDLAADMLRVVNDILQAKGLMLRSGTAVDATLISAPSSTKNADGERDPEMKQTKKGNQWYFGMKAHIGVDAHSGLVHTVRGKVIDPVRGDRCLPIRLGELDATVRRSVGRPRRAGLERQGAHLTRLAVIDERDGMPVPCIYGEDKHDFLCPKLDPKNSSS